MALRIKRIDPDSPAGTRTRAVAAYIRARQAEDQARELRQKAEHELVAVLEEQEMKSASTVVDDVKYTTTVTSRTTTSFDEAGLKRALGARKFNKLTVASLDKGKLTAAIDQGEVDPALVSQFTQINHGAHTVRLTRKVADGNNEAEEA